MKSNNRNLHFHHQYRYLRFLHQRPYRPHRQHRRHYKEQDLHHIQLDHLHTHKFSMKDNRLELFLIHCTSVEHKHPAL